MHGKKMKFSDKNFFSKCDIICKKLLQIWSDLLEKSLMENFMPLKMQFFSVTLTE